MLRHRLHCKIERAETETYLTGMFLLPDAILLATSFLACCCHVILSVYCPAATAALSRNHNVVHAGYQSSLLLVFPSSHFAWFVGVPHTAEVCLSATSIGRAQRQLAAHQYANVQDRQAVHPSCTALSTSPDCFYLFRTSRCKCVFWLCRQQRPPGRASCAE